MKNQITVEANRLTLAYSNLVKNFRPSKTLTSKNSNTNSNFNNPILQTTQASVLTKNTLLKYYRKKKSIKLYQHKSVKTESNETERGGGSSFVFSNFGITSMNIYNKAKQMKQKDLLQKQRVRQALQEQNKTQFASNRHSSSAKSCRTTFVGRGNAYPLPYEGINQYDLNVRPFSSKIKRLKTCQSETVRRDDQTKTETCEDFLIPVQNIVKRLKNPYNSRISSVLVFKQKMKPKYKINRLSKPNYQANQDQFKGWDFETETQTL